VLGSLKIVNGVAIALIAMTAGSELEYRAMKPLLRSIRGISLYGVLGTAVLLTGAAFFMQPWLPFMHGLGHLDALVVSAVLGVVMVAQSPAVVVALRDEMEADGPVARTVRGAVVIAELLVILLFALRRVDPWRGGHQRAHRSRPVPLRADSERGGWQEVRRLALPVHGGRARSGRARHLTKRRRSGCVSRRQRSEPS
jgi:hypothetical protein